MQESELGLCGRYVRPYLSAVYLSSDRAAGPLAAILQQFTDLFVSSFPARQSYWSFSCALAFPKCDNVSQTPLFFCPDDCFAKMPHHICDQQMPLAEPGMPCTPLGPPFAASVPPAGPNE